MKKLTTPYLPHNLKLGTFMRGTDQGDGINGTPLLGMVMAMNLFGHGIALSG
jgi:hypothetical protein